MPFNAKQKFETKSSTTRRTKSAVGGVSGRKAPGTRIGVYIDWRSAASGQRSGRYGRSLRDGR
jgi:hypothetical protein